MSAEHGDANRSDRGGLRRPISRRSFLRTTGAAGTVAVAGGVFFSRSGGSALAAAKTMQQPIGLFENDEGWQLSLGTEFPGAQGTFTRVDSVAHSGSYAGALHGDFTGGGNYVECLRTVDALPMNRLDLWVETADADRIGIRLTDSTGQVHQQTLALAATADWQQVSVTDLSAGSYFGGANDGVWHAPAIGVGIVLDKTYLGSKATGTVYVDDVIATTTVPDLALSQAALGNFFLVGSRISVPVLTNGTAVSWTTTDFWGNQVDAGSVAAASDGTAKLRPAISTPGYYVLDATAKNPDGSTLAVGSTTLALLTPFDMQSVTDSPFGIGTHFTGYSADLIPLLTMLGIKNVRNDLGWSEIEQVQGQYTFDTYDSVMARLRAAGIKVLPIVDYTNQFYDDNSTPYTDAGRAAFAKYAAATLDHYKDQVDWVEVYNEFNGGFGDRGDGPADSKPEYYYPLLAATHDALKGVDSAVEVVGPAAAGVPLQWMETVFQLGGLSDLDDVSIHPYVYPTPPESAATSLGATGDLVKKYNNGNSKPIWSTEQGWPTHTGATGVTEQVQAAYLARAYAVALANGIEKFFWYDFMNDGLDPTYNEHNFGIIRNTGDPLGKWVPKPASVAYAAMVRQLTGTHFEKSEQVGADNVSMLFAKGSKSTRVMWTTAGHTQNVTVTTGSPVAVTDLTGATKTYYPALGRVVLSLTGDPIYVAGDQTIQVTPGARLALDPAGNAFVGDNINLTLTIDTTKSGAVQGRFEIAGMSFPVNVAANQTVAIPLKLPVADAAATRKLIGDLIVGQRTARLATDVDVRLPYEFGSKHVLSNGNDTMRVSFANIGPRQLTVNSVTWTIGSQHGTAMQNATVAAGQTVTSDVSLAALPTGTYSTEATLDVANLPGVSAKGTIVILAHDALIPMSNRTINVDGTLDDLSGVQGIHVDLAQDGKNLVNDYGGADDLSGDVWFTYDADNLYLSAAINDDVQYQDQTGANIWQGDSIQFALTPGLPGETGYGYEYGVALTPDGPQVYRWSAITGTTGQVANPTVAVRRGGTDTVYELAIPWAQLAPIIPADGLMSLSMLVNDNDGGGRKGWIEWGSGVGTTKDQSQFKPVMFD